MPDANMLKRWVDLWGMLGVNNAPTGVLNMYDEPSRAYHTINHIRATLEEFDQFCKYGGQTYNPEAIEMAIWYHDAIYNTRNTNNEEASANLFRSDAIKTLLASLFTQKVANMILATKHSSNATSADAKIMCDADLSILGQTKGVFDGYERNIRKEYDWVPQDQFVKGRIAILQSFLDRENIFQTEFFWKKYEEVARKNIARSIRQLSNRSQP